MSLDKILAYCFDRTWWPMKTRLFKSCLYLLVLLNAFTYLWDSGDLFGPESYVIRRPTVFSTLQDFVFLLTSCPAAARWVLMAVLGISLAGLAGRRRIWSDVLLWLMMLNLHYAIYPGLTGGHYLLNQLLLFQCLLSDPRKAFKGHWQSLQHFLNNAGSVLIMAQVCLIYVISALAKMEDAAWRSGEAVGMIARLWHFGWEGTTLLADSKVTPLLTWLILAYQLAFPLFIWLNPLRKPLLLGGLVIYLYIAFYMGLMSFGFTMLLAHLYFWPVQAAKSWIIGIFTTMFTADLLKDLNDRSGALRGFL